jgi:hypothetical protein
MATFRERVISAMRQVNGERYVSGQPLLAPTIEVRVYPGQRERPTYVLRVVYCPWCGENHAHWADSIHNIRGGMVIQAPCRIGVTPHKFDGPPTSPYEIGHHPEIDQ